MALLDSVFADVPKDAPIGRSEMRWWEYAWLLKHAYPAAGMRVVYIGCDKTVFPVALARLGCEVWAVGTV